MTRAKDINLVLSMIYIVKMGKMAVKSTDTLQRTAGFLYTIENAGENPVRTKKIRESTHSIHGLGPTLSAG
jgi:hypothetical protein